MRDIARMYHHARRMARRPLSRVEAMGPASNPEPRRLSSCVTPALKLPSGTLKEVCRHEDSRDGKRTSSSKPRHRLHVREREVSARDSPGWQLAETRSVRWPTRERARRPQPPVLCEADASCIWSPCSPQSYFRSALPSPPPSARLSPIQAAKSANRVAPTATGLIRYALAGSSYVT